MNEQIDVDQLRLVAQHYLAAGWHPIELPARAKAPPPNRRTGHDGVDMSAAEIEAAAWVGNIGVRMPPDVIGLDADVYRSGGDTLTALIKEVGELPGTWLSHNGRNDGSGIRYFRVPVGMSWVSGLPGIDIIQRFHRFAAVWPSTHPEGRSYQWWNQTEGAPQTDDIPLVEDLPELPWSWISYLSRATGEQHSQAASPDEVRAFLDEHVQADQPSYITGVIVPDLVKDWEARRSRHDSMQHCLIWALENCRAGIAPANATIEQLAELWQQAVADEPRRAELWSDRRTTEFEAMVRHAVGKAKAKSQAEIFRIHDEVAGIPIGGMTQTAPTVMALEVEGSSFDPVDLGPFLSGTAVRVFPDCLTMSDGRSLLHKGRLNGVHGDSGTGKSWLMAFLIRQLLIAGEAVMLLDLEDTPDPLIDRLRQIGVADDAIRDRLVFLSPDEAFNEDNVGRLITTIRSRSVAHVIIDSLGEAFSLEGINENQDVDVAPWLRRVCRRITTATGAGITLIDHGTKAADKPLDPSGSKRKKAAITGTAWLMWTSDPFTKTAGGRASLTCAKDRHGQYRRGALVARLEMGAVGLDGLGTLRLDPVIDIGTTAAVNPETDKRMKARRAVLDTVRRAKVALSKDEIVERSTGVSDRYLRAEVTVLADEGQVVVGDQRKHPANGKTTPLYVLSPDAGK